MNAGSVGSLIRGTGGKLDIETRWAQEVVERQGGKPRHWNQVEMHAKTLLRGQRGSLETKWMNAGNCWEVPRGKFRYWNQMNDPKWGTFTQADTKVSPCATWKAGRGVKNRSWEERGQNGKEVGNPIRVTSSRGAALLGGHRYWNPMNAGS